MTTKAVKTIKSVASVMAVICVVLLVLSLLLMLASGAKNGIFGYKAYVVLSDSMSKTHFNAGDIVVSKSTDPLTLGAGDVITFTAKKDGKITTITHMIREKTLMMDGRPAFVTYGTTSGVNDETPVGYGDVLGKYVFKIPWLGNVIMFLKTPAGFVLLVALPLVIAVVSMGINVYTLSLEIKRRD